MRFPCLYRVALVLPLALCAPLAFGGLLVPADPNWREMEVSMPPAPNEQSLRRFFVTAAAQNAFYVDEASLDVGEDGVVRYVLVVRTSGGAENVTFEGIRCNSGEQRLYAHGRPDGEWVPARRSEWSPIRANSYNMPQAVLAVQHFCDGPAGPRNRSEAIRGLRHGISR